MENLIRKSEKFIIGGLYAVYLIAITAFMAVWVDGVEIRLELWNENATKILTFVIYYAIVIVGFIFFTVMQALVHRLITARPYKRAITCPVFVLSAVFELIKTTLSLLAFIYVKSSSTKPMTPFSTIMIIFTVAIFIIDVFYFVIEIVQTKKIRENYLDSSE